MNQQIIPALRLALEAEGLLHPEASLLAAVSGGADSVALLQGLFALQRDIPFRLTALHVNHGLRGEASQGDEAFVRALCQRMAVPFLCYQADLPGSMDSSGAENRAREARQALYRQAMEACRAHALLLAHHQDDQAETVLMRLMRGAGAQGLGGMRPSQPFGRGLLLRPLLGLPHQVLLDALQRNGLPWREDESNNQPCTLRNRLRLAIMPQLEAHQPKAAQHMGQAAQRLALDEACLSALAREALEEARIPWPACQAFRLDGFMKVHPALAQRMLRRAYEEALAPEGDGLLHGDGATERSLSYRDTLDFYSFLQEEGATFLNLPNGLRARKTTHRLFFLPPEGAAPLPPVTPLPLTKGEPLYRLGPCAFRLSPLKEGTLPNGKGRLALSAAQLRQGPVLRHPLPGDSFHPFGAPGSKPLRRYFTDRKVDGPLRPAWPVLAQGARVLWVAGLGAAEDTRLDDSALALQLEAIDELPYP